jgi:hypothetical protein
MAGLAAPAEAVRRLVPAIHVAPHTLYNVGARDKPGHDGGERLAL